jgi:hypothetical protein
LDERKDELIANAIVNEHKKIKNCLSRIMVLRCYCAGAKSTMFSSPWTCDAVLWHPTFSGKNPFPQSFACDNAWFLLLYLVAKALSVVIAVATTNVTTMTATIAIYLKYIW